MMKAILISFLSILWMSAAVAQTGRVGINTTSPQAILHVFRNGTSGGPFHTNSTAIIESNQHSYIQFSNTNATEAGFLSGNNLTTIRSAFIFGADSTLMFRTGGNNTRMIIKKSGNIGVGTTTPSDAALLDLQSTSRGLLLPRMSTAQRIAIAGPDAGLLVYDITSKTIFMHDGMLWQPFAMMSSNVQGSVLSSQPTATFNDGEFGYAVAIDGEDVIVGAPQNEASVNPGILNAGTATIYAESGGWAEITTLTYPSPMNNDHFGWSVDINGNYAIIGTPDDDGLNTNQGGARIFFFNGTTWAVQSQLNEAGTNFHYGQSVSLIHENTAAIGIPGFTGNGKVDIYTRSGTTWSQTFEIINTGTNNTGSHVVLSGNKICVGAFATNTGIGRFYIYYYNGTTWLPEYESPSATAYSLAFQGNYVALGSGSDVSVYWFNGSAWSLQASLVSNDFVNNDDFGHSVSIDGDYILAGAPRNDINANSNQGSVYVFRRNGSSWIQVGNITDAQGVTDAFFGQSVDISGHQYVIGSQKGNNTKGAVSFGTLY